MRCVWRNHAVRFMPGRALLDRGTRASRTIGQGLSPNNPQSGLSGLGCVRCRRTLPASEVFARGRADELSEDTVKLCVASEARFFRRLLDVRAAAIDGRKEAFDA